MNISIIITSYNNAHNLERCLKRVLNQTKSPLVGSSEIIVIDSGSTDNSQEILRKYDDKIKLILSPVSTSKPLSPALARNLGVQHAKGEILIFTDSDCIPGPQWVHKMTRWYKDKTVDCVIGNREPDTGDGLGTFIRRYDFILYSNKFNARAPLSFSSESVTKKEPFILLASNNFSIKKNLWMKIGGIKNIFPGEDILLEIDILQKGGHILFDPDNIVSHIHPISFMHLLRRAYDNGRSTYLIGLYSKNFINWHHFEERGRNFNIPLFISTTFANIFLLAVFYIEKILVYFLIALLALCVFWLGYRTTVTSARLTQILKDKNGNYLNRYRLKFTQVIPFIAVHFLLKLIASISFVITALHFYGYHPDRKTKIEE